eukprot:8596799-Pyramimonas_sp.AAC.1
MIAVRKVDECTQEAESARCAQCEEHMGRMEGHEVKKRKAKVTAVVGGVHMQVGSLHPRAGTSFARCCAWAPQTTGEG